MSASIPEREPYFAGRVRLFYTDTLATVAINLLNAAVLSFVMRGKRWHFVRQAHSSPI